MSPSVKGGPKALTLISFGHSYGPVSPSPTLSFDIRTIPNPPRELRLLQKKTKDSTSLREWLLSNEAFINKLNEARRRVLSSLKTAHSSASESEVTVGVNCQLGRHRSATFVDELAKQLKQDLSKGSPWVVKVVHRDVMMRKSY